MAGSDAWVGCLAGGRRGGSRLSAEVAVTRLPGERQSAAWARIADGGCARRGLGWWFSWRGVRI